MGVADCKLLIYIRCLFTFCKHVTSRVCFFARSQKNNICNQAYSHDFPYNRTVFVAALLKRLPGVMRRYELLVKETVLLLKTSKRKMVVSAFLESVNNFLGEMFIVIGSTMHLSCISIVFKFFNFQALTHTLKIE